MLHLPRCLQQPFVHAVWPQLLHALHQQILGWIKGATFFSFVLASLYPFSPTGWLVPKPSPEVTVSPVPFLPSSLSQVCQCPLCKKTFQKRPDLQINRTLREITEQFRSMRGGAGLGREKRAGRGGGGGDGAIPDDVFEELRKKLPRPLPKVPSRPTFEPQGNTGSLACVLRPCTQARSVCNTDTHQVFKSKFMKKF